MNSTGNIVGLFLDADGNEHGFLRAPNGTMTPLDMPRALGTVAVAISDAGQITRQLHRARRSGTRFSARPAGRISRSFDPPGCNVNGPDGYQSSPVRSSGFYLDSSQVQHGFLRECGRNSFSLHRSRWRNLDQCNGNFAGR